MILKLYSVRDKLTGFTGPIGFKDDKVATRWFEQMCRQKKDQEYAEAKYFDLYCVGIFDTETGITTGKTQSEIELVREGEQLDEPKA